jgi:nitrite reductase/ring-hydroxylating ferredoxin subunit
MSRAPLLQRLALAAYPPAWRERYGDELMELLAHRGSGWRDLPDLLRGAIDARLNVRLQQTDRLKLAGPSGPISAPLMPALPVVARQAPMAYRRPGVVASNPPIGVLTRRSFLRRVLGAGAALLSIEFAAGTVNFLWPQIREGLGAHFRVGTMADVLAAEPRFASGWPYAYNPARVFLVNAPAATELALGHDVSIPDPAAGDLLALWRKCPHLGCLVPAPCESITRYQCRCHRSTYNILGEKMHEGPAERGLDRFAVRIEDDGMIVIDTGQLTQGPPNRGPDYLAFVDSHPWEATCSER